MNSKIVRAWKDAEYRKQLAAEEQLPESPVGEITELSDEELGGIAGGHWSSGRRHRSYWWCRRRSYYGCYSRYYGYAKHGCW
ncbi:mersacidin/lichenicidin family type 2 lantibiotic [Thermosporothrix hazakensis]|jgi:mersacidin/lichenicidin family type 2 lantibiotic|uniref:Mersacidin/lichenicidin family type 2 lantibiotic n=1 Tax=Thermosporothrix hazakensis TaxID=644383 RepID=A0A326UFF8_THEHA|nr:mersacidin/lichenicidin family type 2 lantibiotic [Thermosporothrix hazakensis]PZW29343.1 mersacidin/lichenicidin family type 2 lantibiotic [Thermosporothrix hazakensis]GCE45306.1 hypothetical protein KTH_01750 [Thermosporothrix hazakensis]